jgi:hypothetical protein
MASKLLSSRRRGAAPGLANMTKEVPVMRAVRNRVVAGLAVGLVVLAGIGLAAADNETGETTSLVGCLDEDVSGSFTLVEQESGDRIALESSEDLRLEDHVGHTIKVTGKWIDDEEQYRHYFQVSAIDMVSDSCQS